jgi:hypothetical protein
VRCLEKRRVERGGSQSLGCEEKKENKRYKKHDPEQPQSDKTSGGREGSDKHLLKGVTIP